LAYQLVGDVGYVAAKDSGSLRKLRTGDGLVTPDEIQDD
jgi:hypothetical protein